MTLELDVIFKHIQSKHLGCNGLNLFLRRCRLPGLWLIWASHSESEMLLPESSGKWRSTRTISRSHLNFFHASHKLGHQTWQQRAQGLLSLPGALKILYHGLILCHHLTDRVFMVNKLSSVLCMCLWHLPTMASSTAAVTTQVVFRQKSGNVHLSV